MVIVSRPLVVRSPGPELLDNFADNEWSSIIWACQTGNVPESWTVGSQKPMTINGKDYPIDIIGLYHDEYADGSGKAPITFQMHELYAEQQPMNDSATNAGGFDATVMKSTYLPAVKALMPPEVQAAIGKVLKKSSAGNQSETILTTEEELFFPTEIEVHGSIKYSKSGEGEQYDYYKNGGSKVKHLTNGTAWYWWNMSPWFGSTTHFCVVGNAGGFDYNSAYGAMGVALAFCF